MRAKLRDVRLPDEDGAGLAETPHDRRVRGRHLRRPQPRRFAPGQPLDHDRLLHRERHARKRAARPGVRRDPCPREIVDHDRVQRRVPLCDAGSVAVEDVPRGDAALAYGRRDLDRRGGETVG